MEMLGDAALLAFILLDYAKTHSQLKLINDFTDLHRIMAILDVTGVLRLPLIYLLL